MILPAPLRPQSVFEYVTNFSKLKMCVAGSANAAVPMTDIITPKTSDPIIFILLNPRISRWKAKDDGTIGNFTKSIVMWSYEQQNLRNSKMPNPSLLRQTAGALAKAHSKHLFLRKYFHLNGGRDRD